VPFRLPNLATEFLGACNTASIAQRIPAGKVLSLLMPFRRNKANLGFTIAEHISAGKDLNLLMPLR
jgi:hypothetical protein